MHDKTEYAGTKEDRNTHMLNWTELQIQVAIKVYNGSIYQFELKIAQKEIWISTNSYF